MFFSIFPTKDNTITNSTIKNLSKTGSNMGSSEILEIYHLTSSVSSRGESRILMHFDLNFISSSISDSSINSGSVEYRLFLKNAEHSEKVPYGFSLEVAPLSQSFSEGRGLSMYDEGLKDAGYSNWIQATALSNWSISGASYFSQSNLTASQYFETGHEDLNINITNIVNEWISGNIENNGLIIKLENVYEQSSTDFYVKKFFSRNAHATERTPKLNVLWDSVLQDDRSNMFYDTTGSLFYYRYINGAPNNVLEPLYVNIYNSSSAVVQTLTASKYSNGVYQISGVLISPTSSTQVYRDVWFNSGQQFFTGNFELSYATGSAFFDYDNVTLTIPNLKLYRNGEQTIIRTFIRRKDYKPALQHYAGKNPVPYLMKNAYYQIQNAETEEIIVDFSTGSNQYSKLSYDEQGNYFELWTDAFKSDQIYKIKVLIESQGQKYVFDKNFTFKIES